LNKTNKISFDFDSTLDRKEIQDFAKELSEKGFELHITTSRVSKRFGRPEWNKDLFEVAEILRIAISNIHFTEGDDKWKFLKDKGFLFHLDDDCIECELIQENTDVIPISHYNCREDFGGKNWKEKIKKLLWY
jgi:hypothetical protein